MVMDQLVTDGVSGGVSLTAGDQPQAQAGGKMIRYGSVWFILMVVRHGLLMAN